MRPVAFAGAEWRGIGITDDITFELCHEARQTAILNALLLRSIVALPGWDEVESGRCLFDKVSVHRGHCIDVRQAAAARTRHSETP